MHRILAGALVWTALCAADCRALDVLVNQVGFEPNSPKLFRVQCASDYAGPGTFSVRRASDDAEVFTGTLIRKGPLWDKFYWEGDFSSLKTAGDYYISATVGSDYGSSYGFTIQENVWLAQTGVLVYKYFWTQRCGVAVPGWHGVCHADDGLRKDNLTHWDAAGGWHDAGDYNKFPQGFAGDGLFALLWLYDNNRAYYDAIDTDANGIPDILDEALHQARWLAKMVEPSGHVIKETQKRRPGASWVRPESDTDNVIGNWDDRWVNPGDENTPQETTCLAALIKMHRILASKGLPTENFRDKALSIWNHRVALAVAEGGHNNLGNAAMQIWGGLDLYAVTGQQDCWDRAVQRVEELAATAVSNPSFYDSIALAEPPGYELGVLAWFAANYPSDPQAAAARSAVVALMTRYKELADNPIGLIRRVDNEYGGGSLQFFPTNPDWNGFYLGINRLYLLLTWAGIEAYKLTYDPSYLRFAVDQYNWVMGANYNRVCMMEQAGDYNLARYHTRYDTIPGHSDGKQPGVVPNGYVRYYTSGLPYIDLSTNRYQTNEGWLINNAAYAMAISEMTVFQDHTPPGQVAGFAAAPGVKQVVLSWTNPSDPDFAGTMIRWKTGGYPTGPTDGTLLADRPGAPGSTDTCLHTALSPDTAYYYAAFAYDRMGNYSSAALAAAVPSSDTCFYEDFSCPDGVFAGCHGWTGSLSEKISTAAGTLRISGGAGAMEVSRRVECGDCATGVIAVRVRIKKGLGAATIWSLWIDDASGANLARWYGTGTQVRGRIGGTGSVTGLQNLTGGWDDLLVKIYPALNRSQFFFNGTHIGTLDHSVTGAGDSVGRLRFESVNNSSGAGQYVWFDDLRVGLAADGSISSVRQLADESVVYLGNKALYLKRAGYGYIEELDRTSGIRIEGTISANEGDLVHLTGTVKTGDGGERYIQLSTISSSAPGTVRPLGAGNRGLSSRGLDGLYVKTWGIVKRGSITGGSFVLTDGSDNLGIKVITNGAPGVAEDEFVVVEGAAGWEDGRVIHGK